MPAFMSPRTATHKRRSQLRSVLDRLLHDQDADAPVPDRLEIPELAGLKWPQNLDLEELGQNIAATQDLELVIKPIPEHLRHHQISGLTTVIGHVAHVFYDADLSPLNQEQTILHEYAHILHGDVRAHSDSTHMRSMFANPIEKRAETTGMHLLRQLQGRRNLLEHPDPSDVVKFLSGVEADITRP